MNEKMFSLLMLTALIPAAQAIEPAPSPDPSNTITINNPSAASKANKTIVCSQITEEQDSLRLKFMDTTGAKVVFYNDSASELKLQIMPAVSGLEASLAGDSLYLRGEFQPETRYSIQLIGALNDEFDISIPATEIIPQNFNSVDAMVAMVERLADE